jgi:hypothetical protein
MKIIIKSFVVALFLISTAAKAAPDPDYVLVNGSTGFSVYSVTDHAAKLIDGSPFPVPTTLNDQDDTVGSSPLFFSLDPKQEYLYAIYPFYHPPGSSPGAALFSYRIERGIPTEIAGVVPAYGGSPHNYADINFLAVSAHYVFVSNLNGYPAGTLATISIYKSEKGKLIDNAGGPVLFAPYPPNQGNTPYGYYPLQLQTNAGETRVYILYNGPYVDGASPTQLAVFEFKCGILSYLTSLPATVMPLLSTHVDDEQSPHCDK